MWFPSNKLEYRLWEYFELYFESLKEVIFISQKASILDGKQLLELPEDKKHRRIV